MNRSDATIGPAQISTKLSHWQPCLGKQSMLKIRFARSRLEGHTQPQRTVTLMAGSPVRRMLPASAGTRADPSHLNPGSRGTTAYLAGENARATGHPR